MTTDQNNAIKLSIEVSPKEKSLIELLRKSGWASVKKITIQNGQPETITVEQTHKLT